MTRGFIVTKGYIIYDTATGKFSKGGKPARWSVKSAKVWESLGKLRMHLRQYSVAGKGRGIPDTWQVMTVSLVTTSDPLDAQDIFWDNGGGL